MPSRRRAAGTHHHPEGSGPARGRGAAAVPSLAALTDYVAALQRGAADQADRERQVRARLLELHEQLLRRDREFHEAILRRDREFHEAMRALTDRLREVTAHRDELEARLLRLRDSPPGRVLRALRSLLSPGAR